MYIFKALLRYTAIFIVTAILLIGMLLSVALIPREKIQANMEESAKYLQDKGAAFPFTTPGIACGKADYYADAVLLNIAYYLDPKHPAESISWAHFFSEDKYNWNSMVTKYLPDAVGKQPEANQQYIRYWHGSLTIVRPLLMWFNISGIYWILGILLFILLGSILIFLIREGFGKQAAALILAMIVVSVWYVPVCLEYIWMFLVMAITSLNVICLSQKKKYNMIPALFLCTGMITIFLDFFTTETLTLLIPLMFMYMIMQRQNNGTPDWVLGAKCTILWSTGYILMWAAKWVFAAVVLKRNVLPFIQSSITEHLGSSGEVPIFQLWIRSVRNNVFKLAALSYGMTGAILSLILFFCMVFIPVLMNRITIKKKIQKQWAWLYLIMGMIPYLRFIIIPGHSAVHSWFTYRAQAASVMALIMVFYEITEITFLKGKDENE